MCKTHQKVFSIPFFHNFTRCVVCIVFQRVLYMYILNIVLNQDDCFMANLFILYGYPFVTIFTQFLLDAARIDNRFTRARK